MNLADKWNGQNKPRAPIGMRYSILPVLEFLLEYDENTISDLLDSADSYGWGDNLTNSLAWANNYYKVTYIIPDFSRYGCLPSWFPKTDLKDRRLTDQGQVDRFLYLLDYVYGGLPEDHTEADPRSIAMALIELCKNSGAYFEAEEEDNVQWELLSD